MKISHAAGLAGALLASHGVATGGPYCSVGTTWAFGSNIGAACCAPVTRRRMHRPRGTNPAEAPTCEETKEPPCCTAKAAGPPVVQSGGSTNLQCGSKYDPAMSSHDIASAVTYKIEPCVKDPTLTCLHAKVQASSDATVLDIHLNIVNQGDTLPSTGLGLWPFSKYCEFSGTVGNCWVPLSAIEAVVSSHSLCSSTIKVAFGIKVSYLGGGGDTCFGQGNPLDGKNWFMSSTISFSCPGVCTQYCCCEPHIEPPPGVVCEAGSAYGYGLGYADFNGDPVGPALSPLPNSCKKWGFYFPLAPAAMAAGLTGTLHVGAGQNDVSKGQPVGTFTATLSGSNLDVSYTLTSGFDLSEVHVYASCSKPDTCAPGRYTYPGSGTPVDLSGTTDTSFSKSIAIAGAPCDEYYIIFHAKVNTILPAGSTCPPKMNDG